MSTKSKSKKTKNTPKKNYRSVFLAVDKYDSHVSTSYKSDWGSEGSAEEAIEEAISNCDYSRTPADYHVVEVRLPLAVKQPEPKVEPENIIVMDARK